MKTKKNPRVYLQDMLAAMARVQECVADGERAFYGDWKLQDALIRQVSIVGEAASKLPRGLQATYAEVPWEQIIGMRNIIIHDYSDIDLPTVWLVAERDMPVLFKTVERMLKEIDVPS